MIDIGTLWNFILSILNVGSQVVIAYYVARYVRNKVK